MVEVEDTIFNLKVVSRGGIIYEGKVKSITSHNEMGVFDVLAQHANFISLISKGLVIRDTNNIAKEIKFDNALIKVVTNDVEIYVGVEGLSPSAAKLPSYKVEEKSTISTY